METIAGDVLLIIIGNPDVLKVWAVFAGSVSLLVSVIYMWKHIEEWRS
jgi:hypothetical protein